MLQKVIQFLLLHREDIIYLLAALYEILARLVPNSGNWSIIKRIIDIIEFLLPNRIKDAKKLKL